MEWQAIGSGHQPLARFGRESLEALARAYPMATGRLRHALADHPLLSFDALAEASRAMNPAHVEVRQAANRNGGGFPFAAGEARDPARVIREIERSGCWVMLRFVEQLPAFASLFEDLITQLFSAIRPVTGEALRQRGFVFISGTGALTPIHFDPEFNVLMQIAGHKRFSTLPANGPWFTPQAHEAFHAHGENLLTWSDDYAAASQEHALAPGDALYVPYKSPHWVEVSQGPSISLSLTWASAASFEQDDAHLANRWLRRFGLSPAPPASLPGRNRAKATLYRLVRKAGLDRAR
jgi:Cupin superfamily protein